jgi:Zn ribbon nucleic-acid-binding protein
MSVYRARSNCPVCNNAEEVWFSAGKIQPLDIVECPKCTHLFEPADFVSTFLEMRTNSTISVSTNESRTLQNNYLK